MGAIRKAFNNLEEWLWNQYKLYVVAVAVATVAAVVAWFIVDKPHLMSRLHGKKFDEAPTVFTSVGLDYNGDIMYRCSDAQHQSRPDSSKMMDEESVFGPDILDVFSVLGIVIAISLIYWIVFSVLWAFRCSLKSGLKFIQCVSPFLLTAVMILMFDTGDWLQAKPYVRSLQKVVILCGLGFAVLEIPLVMLRNVLGNQGVRKLALRLAAIIMKLVLFSLCYANGCVILLLTAHNCKLAIIRNMKAFQFVMPKMLIVHVSGVLMVGCVFLALSLSFYSNFGALQKIFLLPVVLTDTIDVTDLVLSGRDKLELSGPYSPLAVKHLEPGPSPVYKVHGVVLVKARLSIST